MIDDKEPSAAELNWPAFYEALVGIAPWAMTGLPDGGREYIGTYGLATDAFWSDDLEDTAVALWEKSPDDAVHEALEIFCGNVRRAFAEMPLAMVDEWISLPSAVVPFTRDGCIECIDFKLTDPVRDFILAAGRKPDASIESRVDPGARSAIPVDSASHRGSLEA